MSGNPVRVNLAVTGGRSSSFWMPADEFQILQNSQGSIITFLGERMIVKGTKLSFSNAFEGTLGEPVIKITADVQATLVN